MIIRSNFDLLTISNAFLFCLTKVTYNALFVIFLFDLTGGEETVSHAALASRKVILGNFTY